jgi:hypothetical protein
MLYGTNHDELNGHGNGLAVIPAAAVLRKAGAGYLLKNILRSKPDGRGYKPGLGFILQGTTEDIPLVCGIDQNGNGYVVINNNYLYSWADFNTAWQNSGTMGNSFGTTQGGTPLGDAFAYVNDAYVYLQNGNFTGTPNKNPTWLDIIGVLKTYMGVPFTAYVPPPVPAPPAPSAPPTITQGSPTPGGQGSGQTGGMPSGILAPSQMISEYNAGQLTAASLNFPNTFNQLDLWHQIGSDNYVLRLSVKWGSPSQMYWFTWMTSVNGPSWVTQPSVDLSTGVYENLIDWYFSSGVAAPAPNPPVTPTSSLAMPPGYSALSVAQATTPGGWYAHNPTFDSNGIASFAGVTMFSTLATSVGNASVVNANSVGLDPVKVAAGLYAEKTTDLGPITLANNRVYELIMLQVFDTVTQSDAGTFYTTLEGGGPGLLISDPLALVSRIITDIATYGTAEAARAAALKAGVPPSTVNLAMEAYAAAAVLVATVGTGIALSAPTDAAVAAGGTTASTGITGADTATFVATDTGAASAAGAGTTAAATTGGAVAATGGTTAATGAGVVAATGATVEKAVAATVVSAGATALTTEIKKLTGQLPAVVNGYVPGAAAAPTTAPAKSTTTTPSAISPTTILALGGVGLLAILKKK